MTDKKRPDIPVIKARLADTGYTGGDITYEHLRALVAWVEELEKRLKAAPDVLAYLHKLETEAIYKDERINADLELERVACHGTLKGELDGKPVLGNIMDGTDAACPGWWRGHDNGYERGKKEWAKECDAERKHSWHFLKRAEEAEKERDEIGAKYDESYSDDDYKVIREAVQTFSIRNTKLEAERDALAAAEADLREAGLKALVEMNDAESCESKPDLREAEPLSKLLSRPTNERGKELLEKARSADRLQEALENMLPPSGFKEVFTDPDVLAAVDTVRGYYIMAIEAALRGEQREGGDAG